MSSRGDLVGNIAAVAVGAVIGAAAASWFQGRETRRLAKGAARAVYLEMLANQSSSLEKLGGIRRDVYIAELARLGAYLTEGELIQVMLAYQLVPEAAAALETLRLSPKDGPDALQARQVLNLFGERLKPAMELLSPKLWTYRRRPGRWRWPHRNGTAAPS